MELPPLGEGRPYPHIRGLQSAHELVFRQEETAPKEKQQLLDAQRQGALDSEVCLFLVLLCPLLLTCCVGDPGLQRVDQHCTTRASVGANLGASGCGPCGPLALETLASEALTSLVIFWLSHA